MTAIRVALVCSRFNGIVTEQLTSSAIATLTTRGVEPENILTTWVPGAFELPLAAAHIARVGNYDAIIALGAVIRGDTSHYDIVAGQCAAGILRVSLDFGIPVIFGVLTTDNLEQALQRADGKHGDKGRDAAFAALDMVTFCQTMPYRANSDKERLSAPAPSKPPAKTRPS